MLESTFLHLRGVGPSFMATLQAAGITTWTDALAKPLPVSGQRARSFLSGVEESIKRLEARDVRWFGDALPPSEQWRLFSSFGDSAAYVDIETTGLSWPEGAITTIALYDGNTVRTYVRGDNLEHFADDILAYQLLVTWNGRRFDAPILRKSLCIPLDTGAGMAHLDLLPVFRALGLRGGLKNVEKKVGIGRGDLDGVDGWAAVLLWREYERTGNPRALETLLSYNVADVLSLEYLAAYAVMLHTGMPLAHFGIDGIRTDLNPFAPDVVLLRRFFC